MSDPLLSAQRSLLRVAVAAVALVAAAGLFARCARERAAPQADGASPAALAHAIERALEPRLGPSATGAQPTCAVAMVGEGRPDGTRRRLFVLARCQQLCLRDGVVATGTGIGFPAAATVVGDHVVGTEAPTDAHYAADLRAIFPPEIRQELGSSLVQGRVAARMTERVEARFPGARWLGDQAPSGCHARSEGAEAGR